MEIKPNAGKNLEIDYNGSSYHRIPVRTHVIASGDNIAEVIKKYAGEILQPTDMIFISEKIVAISQGRSFHIDDIKPSWLANFLVKFVHKSPYGIGLGSPWTMELAIREAGAPRMILGALAAAVTKPFGIKGVFYKVVGKDVNAIDGPCDYTIPPYNRCAKLGPKEPHKTAENLKNAVGNEIIIIDANDLGVNVLGKSNQTISDEFCQQIFRDNPLGQTNEQTPIAVVRTVTRD
jgi:F420-0:gamma-glutamyl ligase-like protein